MAILKVARLGHPVLRQPAEPVSAADIRSAPVQRLIDDMIETMHEYDGAGLAANQVHVPRQIAVTQHETDHLNGIVYVDRIRDMRTLSHIAEWQRYWLGIREQSD